MMTMTDLNVVMPAARLRAEWLTDPVGIDVGRPRLSWELRDGRAGARQTGYRIVVSDAGGKEIHDTGKVGSSESVGVGWPGKELGKRERVCWRVKVWDAEGKEGEWSAPAWIEAGIGGDFEGAKWIGGHQVGGVRVCPPPTYVRKEFEVSSVKSARLYVTALGLYVASINGVRVGRDELAPGWSDYRKTVYYQTHDVTALVKGGMNCVGMLVGDGWYAGSVEWRGRQFYGDRPAVLARLEVTLADGSVKTVVTDGSWEAMTGEILEGDIMQGEAHDARLGRAGWDKVGYRGENVGPVRVMEKKHGRLVGQAHPPMRVTRVLAPVDVHSTKDWQARRVKFDFGQNLVGKVRLKVKGKPGTTVRVRYAEVLKGGPKDKLPSDLYVANLRSARCVDHYTIGETGEGVFETLLTFHGFRYVEASGWPGELTECEVEALVMHSDYEKTGEFECSDALVNQLQKNIEWGWMGNSLDVPTDCPQRDERLGWTGDAQVFVRTATFNYDVASFFTKWAQDVEDAQSEKGGVPPVCPSTDLMAHDGGPAWADAALICPWTIHLAYGDTAVLEKHYVSMKKFVGFLDETSKDGVRGVGGLGSWEGFGDWLSINADTPKDLIGSAFYAYAHTLMGEIAGALGKKEEAGRHAARFAELAAKFRERYVSPLGKMVAQTQTAALLALHFGLVDAGSAQGKQVVEDLVADIRRRGNKLSSGFVGSPYLPHVLTKVGQLGLAYELLLQKQWPSWLYAVTQGATTIWERWDGWTHDKGFQDDGMNSFNHYAYGAVGGWLYQVVAGLEAAAPGYRKLRLHPHPPAAAAADKKLTHARARMRTVYGVAEAGWRVEEGMLLCKYIVPANTTAVIVSPVDGSEREVSAGVHEVSYPWKA
jgi:alpha-L-rhamnosidase